MSLGFTKEWYEGEGKNIHHARTVVVDSKPSPVDAEPGWNSVQSRRTQHRITYEHPPRWEQQEREQQVAVQYHGYAAHIRWRTKIVQTRSDLPATDATQSPSVFLQEQWEDEIYKLDFSQYFRGLGDAHSMFPDPSHYCEPQPTLPSTFRPPPGPAPPAPSLQPSVHQRPLQLEHHVPPQQQHSREHYPPPGHYQYHHQPWSADRTTFAPAPAPIEQTRRIPYITAPPPPSHRNSYTPRMSGPFVEESDDDALFVGGPPPFPRGNGARPLPMNGARVPEDAYTDVAAPPTQQAPQRKRGRRGKGGGRAAAAPPQPDVGDDDIYCA